MATNLAEVTHTIGVNNQWLKELFKLKNRIDMLGVHGGGRCFKGTDIPLRLVNLMDSRPSHMRIREFGAYVGVKPSYIYRYRKLNKAGQLVNGMKITALTQNKG